MKLKVNNIPTSLITRDVAELAAKTENIYEAVAVIAERAKQISQEIKEEIAAKLADFATAADNLEEVFENREQIEISKSYERMPKPTTIATEEFLKGMFTYKILPEESVE